MMPLQQQLDLFSLSPAQEADASSSASLSLAPDWRHWLAVGDVVAFRFPVAEVEVGDSPQPKVRPCLVLDVETLGGAGGERCALLAYSTSVPSGAHARDEIAVHEPLVMAAAGLRRPTRFVVSRRLHVPLAHGGFDPCAATASPALGRLGGNALRRLGAVRARLHAERHVAAEHRRERRGTWRRRSAVRDVDFVVEARHPAQRLLPGLEVQPLGEAPR